MKSTLKVLSAIIFSVSANIYGKDDNTHDMQCYDTKYNNPCTQENILAGNFYFSSCSSCCNFIQCDESGNAYDRPCAQGTNWDQSILACVHNNGQCNDNKCAQPNNNICPGLFEGTPPQNNAPIPDIKEYNAALSKLDIMAVINDIDELLTTSQSCWPADSFNNNNEASYGPFFIRLAWHCAGTYRSTDGKGGCAGGRQRFQPESAWEDNTNLDKARALLAPIKYKYGSALSWGDLMVLAGTASIINMNGPINQICVGRVDEKDGSNSAPLNNFNNGPCLIPGNCPPPFGQSTIELIYVNPEGVLGIPEPSASATQIRNIFGRMGMNDRETVALIGGGHAFGKSHGACPKGHGPGPDEQPYNPWPGKCGNGRGKHTFTSGIEGEWTYNPLQWDNEYFQLLAEDEYELHRGPGDKYQWKNKNNNLMMMTTDLALIYDEKYDDIVDEFAHDMKALNKEFANAWNRLTLQGGLWAKETKCIDINSHLYGNEFDMQKLNEFDQHSFPWDFVFKRE